MHRLFVPAIACAVLAACSVPAGPPPSLVPRAAEGIDPRVPVIPEAMPAQSVDPAVAERLASLVAQALNGDSAFNAATSQAEALAVSAGAAQSESWIAAEEALTHAIAQRAPTTRALGDIDAMMADTIAAKGGVAPADFAAIRSAAAKVAGIDQHQAARVDAVQKRLRS